MSPAACALGKSLPLLPPPLLNCLLASIPVTSLPVRREVIHSSTHLKVKLRAKSLAYRMHLKASCHLPSWNNTVQLQHLKENKGVNKTYSNKDTQQRLESALKAKNGLGLF